MSKKPGSKTPATTTKQSQPKVTTTLHYFYERKANGAMGQRHEWIRG